MRIALYGVEEANRVATEIRPTLETLRQERRELERLQGRIDALTLATAGAAATNPDAAELRQAREERERLATRMRRGIHAIQSRGVLLKDLERGLVDFYSLMGDRLVFLCWQLGESEVSHWHTLEGGFAGRQPLHPSERE